MADNEPRKNHMYPQYPVILSKPSIDQIVANIGFNDYVRWGGLVAAAVPVGLLIGKAAPKQTVLATCFLTAVAGGLVAVQRSSARLRGWLPNDREVGLYELEK